MMGDVPFLFGLTMTEEKNTAGHTQMTEKNDFEKKRNHEDAMSLTDTRRKK
jgi:hypothetical protein